MSNLMAQVRVKRILLVVYKTVYQTMHQTHHFKTLTFIGCQRRNNTIIWQQRQTTTDHSTYLSLGKITV